MGVSMFSDAAERVGAGADSLGEAQAIVAAMTSAERLECLDGDTDFWPGLAGMIGGNYGDGTHNGGSCARLGVPGIAFSDGPRGSVMGPATCFPVSMARGAAWDRDLERRIGDAIGLELRARGATLYGGVCVNLLRHPAWGRAQETYGEDPFLVGEMGAALAHGVQNHLMACVKHFALNSIENARFQVDVTVDERVLHEVYLPHFRRIVQSGIASVMSAYNSVNGEWCGDNRHLLTEILREQWGFNGFVISDFIFGLRNAAASVRAGLDIEMPYRMVRHQHLAEQRARGEISQAEIDASIARTVATQLRFNARISASHPDDSVLACTEHMALAREAAHKSIVLLRNDGTLPLDPAALRRIAVIGALAAQPNLGDRGSSRVTPPSVVTPLDALRAALPHVEVVHHDGVDLIAAAELTTGCDAAIVIVGYTYADEGEYVGLEGSAHLQPMYPPRGPEVGDLLSDAFARAAGDGGRRAMGRGGDRTSLRLSPDHEALIATVSAAHPRTIVAIMSGSAVVMPWIDDVDAVLMVWYPGMEGGHALADLLLGAVSPSGHLPFTIPTDEAHLPHFDPTDTAVTYDRWHGYTKLRRDGVAPHFPFGFGLSYTAFELTNVGLADPSDVPAPATITATITVTVTNTGHVAGSHVAQVYGGLMASELVRAHWLLVGFARTDVLQPGEAVTVHVRVSLDALAVWRPAHQDLWIEPGEYRFAAVSHSGELDVHGPAGEAINTVLYAVH